MEFRILGPIEVADGDRLLPLSAAGQRALLTMLLLHANEVVSADRLLDALWPDGPPPSGSAALQVRVSHLRKALGSAGRKVVTRPPGYKIEVGRSELDIYRFEELVVQAATADPATAAATLREALALWRGPPLADVAYEEFAQPAIGRLAELRLAAIERRTEADLSLGRHGELIGELEALVAEHPLRERLRGQLMLALYRSGRQAEALGVFQAARAMLVDELGIEPGPALRHLELAILRQEPTLDLAGTEVPDRSLLVVALERESLDSLLALAEPLASKPSRELIIVCLVPSAGELASASELLRTRQETLVERGVVTRTACFTATDRAKDIGRLATEHDVDLVLLAGRESPLEDPTTRAVLSNAPCDVGVLVGRDDKLRAAPVLVPFAGAEHDWTAIELGAWLAGALNVPLWLVGPQEVERDASRLLASASLATQRAFGVTAVPLLVEPGAEGLIQAADDAALVVVGLTDRWQHEGLGRCAGRSLRLLALLCSSPAVVFARAVSLPERASPASPGRSGSDQRAQEGGLPLRQTG